MLKLKLNQRRLLSKKNFQQVEHFLTWGVILLQRQIYGHQMWQLLLKLVVWSLRAKEIEGKLLWRWELKLIPLYSNQYRAQLWKINLDQGVTVGAWPSRKPYYGRWISRKDSYGPKSLRTGYWKSGKISKWRVYVKWKPGKRLKDECVVPTVKH